MDGFGTTDQARAIAQAAGNKPVRRKIHRGRQGFATLHLVAGLALIAAIALLMQLQSGALDPPAFLLPKAAKAKKDSRPAPQFFATESAGTAAPDVDPAALAAYTAREETFKDSMRESWQALGRMDPPAAAALLAEMEQDKALLLLSCLRERELAAILERSQLQQGAQWLDQLGALPLRTALSPAEASAAGELPLDALAERLQHFRIGLGLEQPPAVPQALSAVEASADAVETDPALSAESGEAMPAAEAETAANPPAADEETDEEIAAGRAAPAKEDIT